MTTARCKIVDLDVTRYYHCISRCVRGAFLCGNGFEHRKQWIEDRIEKLAGCFAVSIASFVVMDNHLHLLVRIDPDDARKWTDKEVLRRWLTVYSPRNIDWEDESNVEMWLEHYSKDSRRIAAYRERLSNLGWFMKALKEPLARMANREDGCRGAFWEGRYQSISVLDEEALLATCAYIDLNPVAAGTAATPETSQHTSIRQRVRHFRKKGKLKTLRSARKGSVPASRRIGNAEQDHWLIPLEDRRPHTNARPTSSREGMLEKFTLGNYLLLVEYTGRLFRKGKARISDNVKHVLDRLFDQMETSVGFWTARLKKMLSAQKLRGHCFAASDKGIKSAIHEQLSARANHKRVLNLSPN